LKEEATKKKGKCEKKKLSGGDNFTAIHGWLDGGGKTNTSCKKKKKNKTTRNGKRTGEPLQ